MSSTDLNNGYSIFSNKYLDTTYISRSFQRYVIRPNWPNKIRLRLMVIVQVFGVNETTDNRIFAVKKHRLFYKYSDLLITSPSCHIIYVIWPGHFGYHARSCWRVLTWWLPLITRVLTVCYMVSKSGIKKPTWSKIPNFQSTFNYKETPPKTGDVGCKAKSEWADETKIAMFLSAIGPEALEQCNHFEWSEDEHQKNSTMWKQS